MSHKREGFDYLKFIDNNIQGDSKELLELRIKLLELRILAFEKGIEIFLDNNFHGGAKSNREDYSVMVTTKDIWNLRELLKITGKR